MRPIYETSKDLKRERSIACRFEDYYDVVCIKQDGFAHFDMECRRRGVLVGVAEMKRRYNWSDKYKTFYVSLIKPQAAEVYEARNIPAVFVIQWNDVIGWVRAKGHVFTSISGRSDRNDPDDIEEVAHYRISDFTMFGGRP